VHILPLNVVLTFKSPGNKADTIAALVIPPKICAMNNTPDLTLVLKILILEK